MKNPDAKERTKVEANPESRSDSVNKQSTRKVEANPESRSDSVNKQLNPKAETIAQGAEAILTRENDVLVKERIKKSYRIAELDEAIREKRTRSEERIMRTAKRAGVPVPQISDVSKYAIKMEFIDGKVVRELLAVPSEVCEKIGENAAKLHRNDIIHGDLTTSNMILANPDARSASVNKIMNSEAEGLVWFIDFGLSFMSNKTEDKAVDLQLLKQALESTHNNSEEAWKKVLKAYSLNYNESAGVLQRLQKLEKRGRYKRGKH